MTKTASMNITYTTLSAENEDIHEGIEEALSTIHEEFGKDFPLLIGDERRYKDAKMPIYDPADTREPLFTVQEGSRDDMQEAIAAARAAFPGWSSTPYQERCALVNRVADMIDENVFHLSAMIMKEVGKNRLEAIAEVAETSALLRYYADQMMENNGFQREMESQTGQDYNMSVLRPYGVWAVISPFNFPLALAIAPVGAALIAGNTTVLKPAEQAPYSTFRVIEYFLEAGAPAGVVNYITGPGAVTGAELVENDHVDGITFTGSYDVGFNRVYESFSDKYPKPVIVEMGGKNPAIISKHADLDKAALGVMRAAFGLGGQKCSACSRVYIDQEVYDDFKQRLVDITKEKVTIGDPADRDTYLGPVINEESLQRYRESVEKARADGEIVYGGEVVDDENAFYVEPAILEGLPHDHELVKTELFLPIVALLPVEHLDEAMEKANDVDYGLTAGMYSEDQAEVEWFLNNIQAGVIYVNREGGATTGAWPGYQTFGGWKASGSAGKNIGGTYSLLPYMREQSRTVVRG